MLWFIIAVSCVFVIFNFMVHDFSLLLRWSIFYESNCTISRCASPVTSALTTMMKWARCHRRRFQWTGRGPATFPARWRNWSRDSGRPRTVTDRSYAIASPRWIYTLHWWTTGYNFPYLTFCCCQHLKCFLLLFSYFKQFNMKLQVILNWNIWSL